MLEDPWAEPYEDMFVMTVSPERAPDRPEYVEVDFVEGNPTAAQRPMFLSPAALLAAANTLGGTHGIGRCDLVENRYVGMKARGVYETPGGTISARRAPRPGDADPGPRGDAPARLADSALRRDGLLWLLVRPGNVKCCRPRSTNRSGGSPAPSGSSSTRATSSCAGVKSDDSLYNPGVASFDESGGLSPGGRRRLHPSQLAAVADPCSDPAAHGAVARRRTFSTQHRPPQPVAFGTPPPS